MVLHDVGQWVPAHSQLTVQRCPWRAYQTPVSAWYMLVRWSTKGTVIAPIAPDPAGRTDWIGRTALASCHS